MFGVGEGCIGMAFGVRHMEWKSRCAVINGVDNSSCETRQYNAPSVNLTELEVLSVESFSLLLCIPLVNLLLLLGH
jgi:hypothetical protein